MATDFEQYFTGTDDVNGESVKVYEFPNQETMTQFLDQVGGMPHPLGGLRAVVAGLGCAPVVSVGPEKLHLVHANPHGNPARPSESAVDQLVSTLLEDGQGHQVG